MPMQMHGVCMKCFLCTQPRSVSGSGGGRLRLNVASIDFPAPHDKLNDVFVYFQNFGLKFQCCCFKQLVSIGFTELLSYSERTAVH